MIYRDNMTFEDHRRNQEEWRQERRETARRLRHQAAQMIEYAEKIERMLDNAEKIERMFGGQIND